MTTKSHQYLWIDLATTGLDPLHGRVLEFAAILCEDARGDDFAIVEQYTSAIHYTAEELRDPMPDEAVMRLHQRSGLWTAVADTTVALAEVDELLEGVAALTGGGRLISIAGMRVYFDRAWIRVHMPRFGARLSSNVLDVGSLIYAANSWSPKEIVWPPRPRGGRCIDDLYATIADARVARRAMGWA